MSETVLTENRAPLSLEARRRCAELFAQCSLETTAQPRAIDHVVAASLPRGTSVYITALPSDAPDAAIAAAARLKAAGLNPVPHLAARSFASVDDCARRLARLAAEAGVGQALLVGGDLDRPRGPFASSRQLIETGLLEKYGLTTIGIGAYPEGHPRIPLALLETERAAKLAALKARGIAPYIVTQFCFEAAPIVAWLARVCAQEPAVPVHVGLAGPAKLSTLLRYAAACGIGASLRTLRRQASLTKLLTEAGPEPIIAALAADAAALGAISRLHFFTFGGLSRTAQWAHTLAAAAGGN